jgi:hypothetical protein
LEAAPENNLRRVFKSEYLEARSSGTGEDPYAEKYMWVCTKHASRAAYNDQHN